MVWVECLKGVIKYLRKPEIVSFATSDSLALELVSTSTSLRVLDWSDLDFSPHLHQLEGLLRDLPNPRILCYGHSIIPRSIHFSLTTLTIRTLVPRGDHLGERELPGTCTSLRELVEDGLHYHKLLQNFIIRHGAYLTTVKSHCVAEDLAPLHKSCSELGHLILSLEHLASYDPLLPVKRTFP